MDAVSLRTLADWSGGHLIQGDSARRVTSVSTDTRQIEAGALYIALRGDRFDGHDFLSRAAENGALGVLSEKSEARLPKPTGVILVEDTLKALQRIATEYRKTLPLTAIGLTGSNGKTSTKDMCASVLARRFSVTKTQGNLNNHLGLPLTLLRANSRHEVGIFEMGMNHPGEIAPLAAMARPDLAIVTSIGTAHIEFLGSRENIAEEKGALVEALTSEGTLILPVADDFVEILRAKCGGKVVTVGIDAGEVRASEVRFGSDGTRFQLRHGDETCDGFLAVPGLHMVRNALLAVAAGRVLGLSLAECSAGLAGSVLTGKRMERKEGEGILFLDDTYNANPDSMIAALDTLAQISLMGRRFAVLGRMGELGTETEAGYRRVAEAAGRNGLRGLIVVGEEAAVLAEAAQASGVEEVVRVATHKEAVAALRRMAGPGDAVLVKGSRAAAMELVVNAFKPSPSESLAS